MYIFTLLTCLLALCAAYNVTSRIVDAATTDEIDLYSLFFAAEALVSIQNIYDIRNTSVPSDIINGDKFDVHTHVVPPWYRAVAPTVAGLSVPNWTLEGHLGFHGECRNKACCAVGRSTGVGDLSRISSEVCRTCTAIE